MGESPVLEPVAAVIAAHPEPYRSPGEGASADVPREARILRAVRAFDDARGEGSSTPEALDVLHQRMAYDFDPEVVNALRSVMRRRGLVTD